MKSKKNLALCLAGLAAIVSVSLATIPHVMPVLAADNDYIGLEAKEYSDTSAPVSMDIILNEALLQYIPEYPDASYTAGVHVVYGDLSEDILDPASVQWLSSDEKIFTVNWNGGIQPQGVGTAVVTAEYQGVKAEKQVTINQGHITALVPEDNNVVCLINSETGITAATREVKLYAQASNGVLFEVQDNLITKWKSRTPNIATYSNDGLEVMDEGSTTLTATLNTLVTDVKVTVIDVNDCYLEASLDEVTLRPGEAGGIKIFAISGQNRVDVTEAVSWSVGDESVIEAVGGFLTGLNEGQTEINVSFEGLSLSIPSIVQYIETYSDITLFP